MRSHNIDGAQVLVLLLAFAIFLIGLDMFNVIHIDFGWWTSWVR